MDDSLSILSSTFSDMGDVLLVLRRELNEIEKSKRVTMRTDKVLARANDYINSSHDVLEDNLDLAIAYMTEICVYKMKQMEREG